MPVRAPNAATSRDRGAGRRGAATSFSSATCALSRDAAVTYCVRSFEPMEKKAALGEQLRRNRHGRHLDHDAERRPGVPRRLSPPARQPPASRSAGAAVELARHRHHRQHDLEVAVRRRRGPAPAAGRERSPAAPATGGCRAGRGTGSAPRRSSPVTGLSPPASMVRIVTGLPPPIEHLRRRRDTASPRRAGRRRTGTPSASGRCRRRSRRRCASTSSGLATLTITRIARAVGGARRLCDEAPPRACAAPASAARRASKAALSRLAGAETTSAALAVQQRLGMAVESPARQGRRPSARRASGRASRHGWRRCRPTSAMPPPVDQSASRKRVGVTSSPVRIAPGGSRLGRSAGEIAQHAVAEVGKIGGAGAEILVRRPPRRSRSARRAPLPRRPRRRRRSRSRAAPARSARRRRAWRPGIPGSRRSPRRSAPSAARSARSLRRSPPPARRARAAGSPLRMRAAAGRCIEPDERPGGDARRSGPALQLNRRRHALRSRCLPAASSKSRADQRRQRARRTPRHRRLRRGNAGRCSAAPWRPSP